MLVLARGWLFLQFFQPYISLLFFYILEKQLKNLKIPISILSSVNNDLFISQKKSISVLNMNLFCSYNIISSLLTRFGLVVEHGKTEIFYFSRSHSSINLPSLDLTPLVVYSFPSLHGNILAFTLIESFHSILMSTFTWTRLSLLSNAWKCWAICQKVSILFKKDDYTSAVCFL